MSRSDALSNFNVAFNWNNNIVMRFFYFYYIIKFFSSSPKYINIIKTLFNYKQQREKKVNINFVIISYNERVCEYVITMAKKKKKNNI